MRRTTAKLGLLGLLGLTAAGCDGSGTENQGNPGALERLTFSSVVLFGPVPVQLEVFERLQIQNEGSEDVVLEEIRTDGAFTSTDYEFGVGSELPLRIRPGSPTPLMFSFRGAAPLSRAQTEVTLVFAGGETATVGLQAEVPTLAETLRLSSTDLDFGEVLGGRPAERTLRVTNLLVRPVPIYGLTNGGRARPEILEGIGRFEVDAAVNDDGRLANAAPLEGRGEIDIDVRYVPDPSAVSSDRARWRIGACPELTDGCSFDVFLAGQPVPSPIVCGRSDEDATVTELDFGNLNPPELGDATLTCEAQSSVQLSTLGTPLSGTGIEVTTDLANPPPVQLETDDVFTIVVSFDPSRLEPGSDIPENTRLTLELRDIENDAPFPTVEIDLFGGHGRPELEVAPATLDFQSAVVGTERPERLVVQNVAPIPFSGQVRLAPGASGDADDFASARDGATLDLAVGESQTIQVAFTPQLPAGRKASTLRFETTENSDPRNPDFALEVPLTGTAEDLPTCDVVLSTSSIDFGRSVARTENRGYVAITNVDAEPCLINGLQLAPGADPEISLVDAPPEIRLPGGESALIEIAFVSDRPPDADDLIAEATLEFYVSSDPSVRTVSITGEQSTIDVLRAPNVVDLRGGDPSCAAYEKMVSILNGDASEITVTSIDVVGDDAFAFSIQTEDALPATVPAEGGRLTFDVRLDPSLAEDALLSARVEVQLASGGAPFIIPVLAQVSSGARFVERFEQGGFTDVDLVFVRPNAGGVVALLDEAARRFSELVQPIRNAGMGYQIGFLRAGISALCPSGTVSAPRGIEHRGDCGLLASGPVGVQYREEWRVIDGSEVAPTEDIIFSEQMRNPPSFGFDLSLDAMYRAVHPTTVSDWNAEIHRPNALLHFVLLNNGDDESAGDLAFYADWMRYARGYPRRFDTVVTAVTGPEDGPCSGGLIDAVAAPRLAAFAAQVGGGSTLSVCAPSWAAIMEQVGEDATGIRDRVRLARRANASSMELRVDGTLLPAQNGPETNWRYESSTGVLTLRDPTTKARGAEIEVAYRPVCTGT